ncbi:MAG: glycoside hydrolase domain-containing protein [Ferruginibacter sp.]
MQIHGPSGKIWDEFGLAGSKMIGYWSDNCPVKTDNAKVLATVYKNKNSATVSIASWAAADTTIKLNIDWEKLGIDKNKATITIPEINNFQKTQTINADGTLLVEKNKGYLLLIK